jgi:hydroxypyruvate reductase
MDGAVREASSRGYHTRRIDDAVVGDARTTAVSHVRQVLARASTIGRPACVVSSGETTVHVRGRGRGGRNQEVALASVPVLAASRSPAALASVGTDGVDGPTDAAGAIADSTTAARAATRALRADDYLADNNAYAYFDALGDLIRTGPTGTNVGDLQVILLA